MSDVDEADGAYRRLVVVRVRVRVRDRVRVSGQASRRVGMFCLVRLLPALAAALVPQLGLTPLRAVSASSNRIARPSASGEGFGFGEGYDPELTAALELVEVSCRAAHYTGSSHALAYPQLTTRSPLLWLAGGLPRGPRSAGRHCRGEELDRQGRHQRHGLRRLARHRRRLHRAVPAAGRSGVSFPKRTQRARNPNPNPPALPIVHNPESSGQQDRFIAEETSAHLLAADAATRAAVVAAATRYSGGGADGIYSELFEGVGMGSEAAACAAHLLEPGGMCTPCARHVQCACHVRVRACMCMCVHVHVHAHAHVHACTRCAALDLGLGGAADGWSATGRTWVLDPIDGTKGFLRGDQYAVCIAANALRAHVHRTARAHGPRPTAHYTRPTTHGPLHTARARAGTPSASASSTGVGRSSGCSAARTSPPPTRAPAPRSAAPAAARLPGRCAAVAHSRAPRCRSRASLRPPRVSGTGGRRACLRRWRPRAWCAARRLKPRTRRAVRRRRWRRRSGSARRPCAWTARASTPCSRAARHSSSHGCRAPATERTYGTSRRVGLGACTRAHGHAHVHAHATCVRVCRRPARRGGRRSRL